MRKECDIGKWEKIEKKVRKESERRNWEKKVSKEIEKNKWEKKVRKYSDNRNEIRTREISEKWKGVRKVGTEREE